MTTRYPHDSHDEYALPATPVRRPRWLRILGGILGLSLLLLFLVSLLWHTFFHYVPPGQMLVIIAKNGDELGPDQVLAHEGQKGIQEKVLGEGWHYVTPIMYTTELKPNTFIKPGYAGIVTSQGGKTPKNGILTDADNERGIRRQVLTPGSYRINPYGFKIEEVPATLIKPGFIGVVRRLLGDGEAGQGRDKGILREVLQPGLYYLNTKEFEILPREIGIYQTTYHYDASHDERNTAITFPARDGNLVSMDCTIEWEVKPSDWPDLIAVYDSLTDIEHKVVDQHAKKISRERGFNYRVQDFLEGSTREKFQSDFYQELHKACAEKKVGIHSAFIRNTIIPENFLEPKRARQLAMETKQTSQAKQVTAQTEAEVAKARGMIAQGVAEVAAETERLVAGIDRQAENIKVQTEAEIEGLKARYGAQIALLDNERTKVLGQAEAQAKTMTETAKSGIYKMKMDLFRDDGNAYLRYTMAEKLNEKLVLRLYQSGPGTLWTNLGDKNTTLLLPAPGNGTPSTPAK
ncbi:MAG: SPFH domain-containing protein [Gemmataceae bacterium]